MIFDLWLEKNIVVAQRISIGLKLSKKIKQANYYFIL